MGKPIDSPNVEVMKLIRVGHVIGAGKSMSDPVRAVHSYYTMDGEFVFRDDPLTTKQPEGGNVQ